MTIGQLIAALKRYDKDSRIYFDFCETFPTTVDSWRGDYSVAALGWSFFSTGRRPPTVKGLIEELEKSIAPESEYQGYKGGRYKFDADTPIMVDNYGQYTETHIDRVEPGLAEILIITKKS